MAISKKSYLVVAKETTPGTAILTGTKLFSTPAKSNIKGVKKRDYPQEERGDRNANYLTIDTERQSDIDVKGAWYNDTFPLFLLGWFGQDTVTQPDATNVPTCYLHTLSFADIPPSLTIHKHYDAKAYYAAYSVLEKLVFKFDADGKLFDVDANLKALWPVENASPPAPNFSTVNPMAGYAPKISLNGTETTDIDQFQIELSQKITLWHPCNGVLDWTTAYFGERMAKVDFTARFDNDTIYQRFRNGLNDSFSFTVQGDLIGTGGATNYYQELKMVFDKISYDTMEHDLGKDNVLIKAKATVLPAANKLVSLCTVQNTVSSY